MFQDAVDTKHYIAYVTPTVFLSSQLTWWSQMKTNEPLN